MMLSLEEISKIDNRANIRKPYWHRRNGSELITKKEK